MSRRVAAVLLVGVGLGRQALADEPPKPAPSGAGQAVSATSAPSSPGDAAKEGAAAIAEARRAVEDQRYDDALALLSPHLSSTSRATRAAALEVTAIVRLLLGRTAEGREALAALYELAPAFQLDDPSLPPRVTKAFEAEAAQTHGRAVTLAIRPSASERGVFDVSAAEPTRSVDLSCSSTKPPDKPGSAPKPPKPPVFSPVTTTHSGGAFHFRLPTLEAYGCFAVARDADGLPLGRLGSSARPVDVALPPAPPPAPPTPVFKRWWFWTGIGVAAGAIGLGLALGLRRSSPPPEADITIKPQSVVFSW